jgi:hypothetical protein
MKKNLGFRAWFFFRTGWSTYFALIFSAVNTMVVTYYLAIEKVTLLEEIFNTFTHYFIILSLIGIPILVTVGYVHYKRTSAFTSEMDIGTEANPYYFKLPPGYWKDVIIPFYLTLSEMMIKTSKEKLTDEELEKITDLQKKMDILIKGGYVGDSKKFQNKVE